MFKISWRLIHARFKPNANTYNYTYICIKTHFIKMDYEIFELIFQIRLSYHFMTIREILRWIVNYWSIEVFKELFSKSYLSFYLLSRGDWRIFKKLFCECTIESTSIYTNTAWDYFTVYNSLCIICNVIQCFDQFLQLYIQACFSEI